MKIKDVFSSSSPRVKGLALHPSRTFLLSTLHTGAVQLWDYSVGCCIDQWTEHEGPVRGVAWHPSQAVFATGGDDFKLRLWNVDTRRCYAVISAHQDYIRTVEFHPELPWVLSASDDQSVRIFNFMNRSVVSVMQGHSHYVMCATFHPELDLIASASLDATIRVWDFSALRQKHLKGGTAPMPRLGGGELGAVFAGGGGVVVKFMLEGHDLGVNWVSFHPTKRVLASGSDDRTIKLWKFESSRAWESGTLRGHAHNVSSVMFCPADPDFLISNGEDKTLRVWNWHKRDCLYTLKKDGDRYWCLTGHLTGLLAAGHDSGFHLFRLGSDAVPYTSAGRTVIFVRNKHHLVVHDLVNGMESVVAAVTKDSDPIHVGYGPHDAIAVLTVQGEGKRYRWVAINTTNGGVKASGGGGFAVFLTRRTFAAVHNRKLVVYDTDGGVVKRLLPNTSVDQVYPGPQGTVVVTTDNKVMLVSHHEDRIISSFSATHVRNVKWSGDHSYLALVSNHGLWILQREGFKQVSFVHEWIRARGGAWMGACTFVYSTQRQIKYLSVHGDCGVVSSTPDFVHPITTRKNTLVHLTTDGKVEHKTLDTSELQIKDAIHHGDRELALRTIARSNLPKMPQPPGPLVDFLLEHRHADIALSLTQDPTKKFLLALDCGHLKTAQRCCAELKSTKNWRLLGEAAQKFGKYRLARRCFESCKDTQALFALFFENSDVAGLQSLVESPEYVVDDNLLVSICMLLGKWGAEKLVEHYTPILPFLAYSIAARNGLDAMAEDLESQGFACKVSDEAAGIVAKPFVEMQQREAEEEEEEDVEENVIDFSQFHGALEEIDLEDTLEEPSGGLEPESDEEGETDESDGTGWGTDFTATDDESDAGDKSEQDIQPGEPSEPAISASAHWSDKILSDRDSLADIISARRFELAERKLRHERGLQVISPLFKKILIEFATKMVVCVPDLPLVGDFAPKLNFRVTNHASVLGNRMEVMDECRKIGTVWMSRPKKFEMDLIEQYREVLVRLLFCTKSSDNTHWERDLSKVSTMISHLQLLFVHILPAAEAGETERLVAACQCLVPPPPEEELTRSAYLRIASKAFKPLKEADTIESLGTLALLANWVDRTGGDPNDKGDKSILKSAKRALAAAQAADVTDLPDVSGEIDVVTGSRVGERNRLLRCSVCSVQGSGDVCTVCELGRFR